MPAALNPTPSTISPTFGSHAIHIQIQIVGVVVSRHLLTAPLAALMIHSGATGAGKETQSDPIFKFTEAEAEAEVESEAEARFIPDTHTNTSALSICLMDFQIFKQTDNQQPCGFPLRLLPS